MLNDAITMNTGIDVQPSHYSTTSNTKIFELPRTDFIIVLEKLVK